MLGTIHDHYSSFINSLGITKCWRSNSNFYLFHLLAKIDTLPLLTLWLLWAIVCIGMAGKILIFLNLKHFFPFFTIFAKPNDMWNLCSLPGIRPMFSALKVWSLNHWTTSEVSFLHFFLNICALLYCSWLTIFQMYSKVIQLYIVVLVTQSCPTRCDPMDCNLPGSSVHGIL